MTYPEAFSRLTFETAVIVFLKKNGEVRLMLGTRNLNTVSLLYGFQGAKLGGHDNRCNITNGNLAVFDLVVGDARSFNIERLLSIDFVGEIKTMEQYNTILQKYVEFKNQYEATNPMMISMDIKEESV